MKVYAARYGYDVFLSHSSADKTWVRDLAKRLADTNFNGRPLRPWLDEQILDPGLLSSNDELTSAMDESRVLVLVLSTNSAASPWVKFEIEYFVERRRESDVVVLLKETCGIPGLLENPQNLIDFSTPSHFEDAYGVLVRLLCQGIHETPEEARARIDLMMDNVIQSDPGGLWPDPTPERDALMESLLQLDIGNSAGEGPALAAFEEAGKRIAHIVSHGDPAGYNVKMLLGDCLAVANLRSSLYRQVMQRLIDLEDDTAPDPALYFAVVRAVSKLAEIDPTKVDSSVLLRVASKLDAGPPTGPKQATGMLIGHVIGKVRESELGQFLIKALSEMGPISRCAVCVALSMKDIRSDSIYYLSELRDAADSIARQGSTSIAPPTRRLVSLLSLLGAGQNPLVEHQVGIAKNDLRKVYGINDFPYPHLWLDVRRLGAPSHCHNIPFAGRIVRADTTNMVDVSHRVSVGDVVCLAEPRVVDALFDKAGAILTTEPDLESPRHRRLQGRDVPYGVIEYAAMDQLADGDLVVVDTNQIAFMAATGQ